MQKVQEVSTRGYIRTDNPSLALKNVIKKTLVFQYQKDRIQNCKNV